MGDADVHPSGMVDSQELRVSSSFFPKRYYVTKMKLRMINMFCIIVFTYVKLTYQSMKRNQSQLYSSKMGIDNCSLVRNIGIIKRMHNIKDTFRILNVRIILFGSNSSVGSPTM